MKWHLDLKISPYNFRLNYRNFIFSIGSCFAENVSEWLSSRYFRVLSNPNGVLFNPMSIYMVLKNIVDCPNDFDEKFLFQDKNYWKSFLHQTHFKAYQKNDLLDLIKNAQSHAYDFLKQSDCIFITFGSAYVYEHVQLNEVVANCHKLPQTLYHKKLLNVEEIVNLYSSLIIHIKNIRPGIKIVFSVSPVKYLSYGAVDNNISKSVLLLAVHRLCQSLSDVYYFPAYELVIDDLRDYRFFKEDMAHPNHMAIDYVMFKFNEILLDDETKVFVQRVEKIIRAQQHRIVDLHSEEVRVFAQKNLDLCRKIEMDYHIDMAEAKQYFHSLL